MAQSQEYILTPSSVNISFSVEPVINFLVSLLTIDSVEEYSGFSNWVYQTADALTPKQAQTQRLTIQFFFKFLLKHQAQTDVPGFIDHVASQDPVALRESTLKHLWKPYTNESNTQKKKPIDKRQEKKLLSDSEAFVQYFKSLYPKKTIDAKLHKRFHSLLNDPPKMLETLVSHLKFMWETYLEAEWKRAIPLLRESVAAFENTDFSGLSTYDIARKVLGRDSLRSEKEMSEVRHIVFTPSSHIGPYNFCIVEEGVMRYVFNARIPEGMQVASPDLSRSDLLIKMNALADDVRLHILELCTNEEELSAQDIIERLNQSQSSVSRHLIQLVATGFLSERRKARGKKMYRLNVKQVEMTLSALSEFLKKKQVS